MTGGGEPGRAFAAGVLRSALALLRRHALAFAGLGAALGLLPMLCASEAVPLLLRAGAADGVVDDLLIARAVAAVALPTLAYLGATTLDVAVVAVALGRGHGLGGVLRLAVRLLPINLTCWIAGVALVGVAPVVLQGVIAAALTSWSILLPAFVAERLRLRDLLRRSLALFRRCPATAAALYACDLAIAWAIATNVLGSGLNYPLAAAGDWARAFAWNGAAFAVQIAADAVFTALYLALRRDEGALQDAEIASAFE